MSVPEMLPGVLPPPRISHDVRALEASGGE
jgi:hypothetical protein